MARNYWLHLFTGTTWDESWPPAGDVSGFREGRWKTVQQVKPGDYLLCDASIALPALAFSVVVRRLAPLLAGVRRLFAACRLRRTAVRNDAGTVRGNLLTVGTNSRSCPMRIRA